MKWADSHLVEGTDPPVRIGRPLKKSRHNDGLRPGRNYHARFTLDGRQVSRSLGTGNKKEAIRRVHELQSSGKLAAEQSLMPSQPLTIGGALDEYLEVCRHRDLAPRTLQKYELTLKCLRQHLGKDVSRTVDSYSERDLWAFNYALRQNGVGEKTRYDRLVIVKQVFKYLYRDRRIAGYRLGNVNPKRPDAARQPCFTPEQVTTLLARADEYHRPIFTLMAHTGLRFGEVRDLTWQDLLLDQGQYGFIEIRRGGSDGKTKGKRIRRLPLHAKLRAVLDQLPRRGDLVFCDRNGALRFLPNTCLREKKLLVAVKDLCARCGFVNPRQYKLHTFRHAFCSMCARNNVSYKYALEWLGHRDSRILDMYYTMYDATAEKAMALIDYGDSDTRTNRDSDVPAA